MTAAGTHDGGEAAPHSCYRRLDSSGLGLGGGGYAGASRGAMSANGGGGDDVCEVGLPGAHNCSASLHLTATLVVN